MKAVLVGHQIEFPKTHDIAKLLDRVATVNPIVAESRPASGNAQWAAPHADPQRRRKAHHGPEQDKIALFYTQAIHEILRVTCSKQDK